MELPIHAAPAEVTMCIFDPLHPMWWTKIFPITVYPKKYAHGYVVLCFVVVMQSCIMNSHEVFIHIPQDWFAGTGAIVRLPQCQWSKPDGYGKISLCITTTKHSKAKTVCIFLGIYCMIFQLYTWSITKGAIFIRIHLYEFDSVIFWPTVAHENDKWCRKLFYILSSYCLEVHPYCTNFEKLLLGDIVPILPTASSFRIK